MPKAALQAEQCLGVPGTLIAPHLAQMQVRAGWGAGKTQSWHTVLGSCWTLNQALFMPVFACYVGSAGESGRWFCALQ